MGAAARQGETRERITRTALQLFAERGLENVSIRDLNQASGVRNQSAVYYHFGGREGLVLAVLEEAIASLEGRLQQTLAQVPRAGGAPRLRDLLGSFIGKLVEAMQGDVGRWRVQFVLRIVSEGTTEERRLLADTLRPFTRQLEGLVRVAEPQLGEAEVTLKTLFVYNTVLHTLSGFGMHRFWHMPEMEIEEMKEVLLDFLEGGVRFQARAARHEEHGIERGK